MRFPGWILPAILGVAAAFFCALATATDDAVTAATVVIVGTIHGRHLRNPYYTTDALKNILTALRPDALLVEAPAEHVGPDGRYCVDPSATESPEPLVVQTYAIERDLPLIPIGWADGGYQMALYRSERQQQAISAMETYVKELASGESDTSAAALARVFGCLERAECEIYLNEDPRSVNSLTHDEVSRAKQRLWYEVLPGLLPDSEEFADARAFFEEARRDWRENNRIMADNIEKEARSRPRKRVVVVTGATHRPILRELLQGRRGIALREYWELIGKGYWEPIGEEETELASSSPDDAPAEETRT